MSLSPGLVHSCSELLSLVARRPLTLVELRGNFTSIGVISTARVIEHSQKMHWMITNDSGFAEVTSDGQRFLSSEPVQGRMRQAILDLIEIERPFWVQNAIQGRRRVLDFVNTALAQVFLEGGLVGGTSPDVVEFWDRLAAEARGQRNAAFLSVGRAGERLSIAYETLRTGRKPKWVAVDNNADGFDLLSVVSSSNVATLSIEVKATMVGISASLHVTRNEWDYASTARKHIFHIWDMAASQPHLAVLESQDVGEHIPTDKKEGLWQEVEIPFTAFKEKMTVQADLTGQAVANSLADNVRNGTASS